MEKFYLELPSIERKEEVKEYIEEFFEHNSNIAGVSGLDSEYLNYESWLSKMDLLKDESTCPENLCPGIVYFLIRKSDNKIIGMINLRWNLNEWMLTNGGHIGYSIRPTERQKGYNKISLYLCLLKAQEIGIEDVLLVANENNIGSIKTIESFNSKLENKTITEEKVMNRYWINVQSVIEKEFTKYEKYISGEETILKKQ